MTNLGKDKTVADQTPQPKNNTVHLDLFKGFEYRNLVAPLIFHLCTPSVSRVKT